jgi:hypothetical protein
VVSAIINGPILDTLYDDLKFVAITSFIVNHTVKAPQWYKRSKILWSIMQIEYQSQLASSILLILKEGQNPKYAGPLGPYTAALLILVEVFAPLVSPCVEELIAHGKVNTVSFLNFNLPFVFSPLVSIPLSV